MRYLILCTFVFCSVFGLQNAAADQNDKHLDILFKLLHKTDNTYEGAEITRQIWFRWQESDNSDVENLMERGIIHMQHREYQKALNVFSNITEIAPSFAEGWNKRATVYFLMGDLENSTRDVDQTLALEPRHFGAIAGQGYIYLKRGDRLSAMTQFKKALNLNPFLTDLKSQIQQLETQLRRSIV